MHPRTADIILFLIVIVLGATFIVVKDILGSVGPLSFLFVRFLLALIVILPWTARSIRQIRVAELKAGILLGLALASGFTFQTIGLQTTAAGKAAFITGLNVVLVPLLARIWFNERIHTRAILGVGCACLGLALLCLDSTLTVHIGDIWIVSCALAFAVHVAGVTRFAAEVDSYSINLIQIAVTTIISGLLACLFEQHPTMPSQTVIVEILFMGIIATALILFFQIVAQRHTTATRAALLFSLEPVFAALFAWIFLGETMSLQQSFGAGLMLAGVILAELKGSGLRGSL